MDGNHKVKNVVNNIETLCSETELGLGHLGELHVALTVLDVRDPIVFNTCGRRWNAQATCSGLPAPA